MALSAWAARYVAEQLIKAVFGFCVFTNALRRLKEIMWRKVAGKGIEANSSQRLSASTPYIFLFIYLLRNCKKI